MKIYRVGFGCLLVVCMAFFGLAHAHNKVVVIPMAGDDLEPLKNIVTVAKKNGDFTDPVAAMASISDASSANPYLMVIAPGVYNLTQSLVTKPFVDIAGSGRGVTKLSASTLVVAIELEPDTNIQDLSVEVTTTAVQARGFNITDPSASPRLSGVSIKLTGGFLQKGIFFNGDTLTIRDSDIQLMGASSDAKGIESAGDVIASDLTITGTALPSASFLAGLSLISGISDIRQTRISLNGASSTVGVEGSGQTRLNEVEILLADGSSLKGVNNIGSLTMLNSTIEAFGGSFENIGVVNGLNVANSDRFWISNSTIRTEDISLKDDNGSDSDESYVANTFLEGSVTGTPVCSFVFETDGTALDSACQ